MAKHRLQNINGHFVESDYENALISYLEAEQWSYVYGDSIPRTNRKEVLYLDDLFKAAGKYPVEVIRCLVNTVRSAEKYLAEQ